MSLLKPTPGQVLDRISIVRLKIEAYQRARKVCYPLVAELTELEEYISKNFPVGSENATSLGMELDAVHRELWGREDAIRDTEITEFSTLAQIAKRIAQLNDQRARLIRELDALYGCAETVEEKIYSSGM